MDSKGFTLVEILVALTLFAIGALALAQMQVLSIRGSSFSKDAVTATTLGERQLEALKNMPFNSIVSNTTGVIQQGMTITWTVTGPFGTAPATFINIVLTVSWPGKSITFTTIHSAI